MATPSVISLLLHNLFNASIPTEHIPKDSYEWDFEATLPYSLATPYSKRSLKRTAKPLDRNAKEMDEINGDTLAAEETEQSQNYAEPEVGCWVHKESREPLGGMDGRISFTVIGLILFLQDGKETDELTLAHAALQ